MEEFKTKKEEAEALLMDYGEVMLNLKRENETLKKNLEEVKSEYQRIPQWIRHLYLKDKEANMLIGEL